MKRNIMLRLTFQLGGIPRSTSLMDLTNALELWPNNETLNPYFLAFFYAAHTTSFTSQEVPAYWTAVGNFEYGGRSPSYTYI